VGELLAEGEGGDRRRLEETRRRQAAGQRLTKQERRANGSRGQFGLLSWSAELSLTSTVPEHWPEVESACDGPVPRAGIARAPRALRRAPGQPIRRYAPQIGRMYGASLVREQLPVRRRRDRKRCGVGGDDHGGAAATDRGRHRSFRACGGEGPKAAQSPGGSEPDKRGRRLRPAPEILVLRAAASPRFIQAF
jgi:hypothetical protein